MTVIIAALLIPLSLFLTSRHKIDGFTQNFMQSFKSEDREETEEEYYDRQW